MNRLFQYFKYLLGITLLALTTACSETIKKPLLEIEAFEPVSIQITASDRVNRELYSHLVNSEAFSQLKKSKSETMPHLAMEYQQQQLSRISSPLTRDSVPNLGGMTPTANNLMGSNNLSLGSSDRAFNTGLIQVRHRLLVDLKKGNDEVKQFKFEVIEKYDRSILNDPTEQRNKILQQLVTQFIKKLQQGRVLQSQ